MKHLRTVAFSIGALVLGLVGLALVFSDLGPGESLTGRILIAGGFFLLSGALIGFFNPTAWMISGLTAWGGIFLGGFITLAAIRRYGASGFTSQEPPFVSSGLLILVVPVTLSLVGGYIGKRVRQKRL